MTYNKVLILGFLWISTLLTPSASRASDLSFDKLFDAMQQLALKCTIRPYAFRPDGQKVIGRLQSVCNDSLEIVDHPNSSRDQRIGTEVVLRLQGEAFRLLATDSECSDDGDFIDLSVVDFRGQTMGVYKNILAYRDPLEALLGHLVKQVREVFDPSVVKRYFE